YRPGVQLAALAWSSPAAPAARLASAALRFVPGPGYHRGEPAGAAGARASLPVLSRPLHCVNCGECNAVCPLYDALALRLPQSLVHAAETAGARRALPAGAAELLDLCLRCGGCEQVCQAGIAHLATYAALEALRATDVSGQTRRGSTGASGAPGAPGAAVAARTADGRAARQATLAALRRTPRYRRAFLELRPGEYLRRTPASVPGRVSYLVLRAEADDGAASTCRHCAACVAVCPSGANREFEADDARLITTVQGDCVGCGTCVEVCPANRDNGGQTLRVVEAPASSWLAALDEFETLGAHGGAGHDGDGAGRTTR
ncbi:MAG TPA: 4Fe-4S dicluster domain-containing protein, partial [Thermoleophilia bacterium]|nr:4Fe-4S dicluster domain-containing protein [Thermoleophilia bacterium]